MDRDEVLIVLASLVQKSCPAELLGPLRATDDAVERLLLTELDKETEVELANEHNEVVAVLYVDPLSDPLNTWTIGLRGWLIADDVASV